MPTTPPSNRAGWRTALVVVLTVGLLWFFFRDVDVTGLRRALGRAHLGLITAAMLSTLPTYVLRAWRWQALLAPLGHARFRTAFRTTVIGFAATFLLPARAGEVLRPYLLAREEGFKATSAFATIIIERLLDLATVLLLFAVAMPFLGVDVGPKIRVAGVVAAGVAVVGLGVLCLSAGHPERLEHWVAGLIRWLPAKIGASIGRLVRAFAEGLAVLRRPAQLLIAAAWSVPLWLSIALGIWLTSLAFGLTISYSASFLILLFLVVGVAAPTPGGVGGFHAAYLAAVTWFFGADPDVAAAAALVLHAVSFVPVTLLGLVFMSQDGLTLGGLKHLREGVR